tara:strand:+ start:3031 stop:3984 length:954 start_codon:yes stop_codon:yes gene_type:complete
MDKDNDGWSEVDVSAKPKEQEQIEFELEEEEPKVEEVQVEEPKEEVKEEPQEEEAPKELEGIETKGAEKRIRQLVRQRKEREETIQTLLAQNEELKNNLSKKDKEVVSITSNSLNANEQSLEKTIKMAKEAYLEAFENGEKEKVLEAQETLNNAQADLKMLQRMKVNTARQQKELEEQPEPQVQQQSQTTAVDVKAQEWAEQNDWFGNDTIKTAAALALDAELKSEGYDPNDNEFYEEIDRRLEKAFGNSSVRVEENTTQPSQVVSGASRSSRNSNSKVKLSKEDVRLANKWGIPLEQYAAEKLKVTTADGEYTNVI